MATANKFLEQPARGSLSGVWDTPVNNNMGIIDASFGGVATISIASTGVVLSQSQYQCAFIRFIGNLTTDIPIQFPAIGGFWTIINDCTNFNNAVPYCYTGLGNYIGFPPGTFQIMSDSVNMRYASLPPVGTYMTVASNSHPRWTLLNPEPRPYLNCDGSAFNTTTYNRLAEYLGFGSTPDLRGRAHYTTDQSTGRITGVVGGGFTGAGGDQWEQNHSHSYSNSVSVATNTGNSNQDLNHAHIYDRINSSQSKSFGSGQPAATSWGGDYTTDALNSGYNLNAHNHFYSFSVGFSGGTSASGPGGSRNMPPMYQLGITLIRTGYP